jgi:serine/threonine protein kinase
MEYCNAGSVADIMGICDIRLDEEQISHVCASVLLGFEYLHASRHIHRVRTYLL